jgi:hypothetical protein
MNDVEIHRAEIAPDTDIESISKKKLSSQIYRIKNR